MNKVCISKTIDLMIKGIKRTFPMKDIVISELTEEVNVG